MNKYNPFSLLIPFLLCSCVAALPIDVTPKYDYTPRDIRILSVGDWGSAALGGYHLRNAENTAKAMSVYVKKYNPKLVLNTGDNFYYCGIHNTSDPQVSADYVPPAIEARLLLMEEVRCRYWRCVTRDVFACR